MYKTILFVIACVFLPYMVHAEDEKSKTGMSIGIVDTQKLMSESKAAKSIQSQGAALRKKYQKKIDAIEVDIKNTEKQLVDASKDKDKDVFISKQKDLQKKVIEGQKDVAELNVKMDKAIGEALKKLRNEIIDVVDGIAEDKGLDMVISNTNVLVTSGDFEITDEVMSALNKKISSISVRD